MRQFLPFALLSPLLLGACSSRQLTYSATAPERFAMLGNGERRVAREFYHMGEGDEIKRLYWAQRNSTGISRPRASHSGYGDSGDSGLKHELVTVPIPASVSPDGTQIEPHMEIIDAVK